CIGLNNLTISDSVTYFGHNVFDGWGVNIEYQELNVDFYEGFVPGETDWNAGIDESTVQINYREPTTIYIELNDGSGKTIAIKVKPGLEMPELGEITRRGYEFKGIFSRENGSGYQYYTDSMEVAKLWKEGDSDTLYVNWKIIEYKIEYDYSQIPFEVEKPYNPSKYTVEDGEILFNVPHVAGYFFWWNTAGTSQDDLRDIQTTLHCEAKENFIDYVMNGGTNHKDNPDKIKITDIVELQDPVKSGHMFIGWKLDGEFVTELKNIDSDITLEAIWARDEFSIAYVLNGGTNNEDNPVTIKTTDTVVLKAPEKSGYVFIGWKLNGVYVTILKNVDSDITLEAIWTTVSAEQKITLSETTTRVSAYRVKVDLTDATSITGCTLIVESTVMELVIYSKNPITYNMSIIVENRGADISITLMNVNLHGTSYRETINIESKVTLHLYALNSSLYGQNGYNGTNGSGIILTSVEYYGLDGSRGGSGLAAIKCYRLVIHDGVAIYGGSGGNGGHGARGYNPGIGGAGGSGAYAVNAQEIVVMADGVKLVGGNGGNGGDGAMDYTCEKASAGGAGGAGAKATNATITGNYVPELTAGQKGANGARGSRFEHMV
ncbi:MAG: InlB B-repeat-containing protein, partial [Clostridiales bacterium]|nr:InlB B-repeat-containing protein [Clostridiales bacterium]